MANALEFYERKAYFMGANHLTTYREVDIYVNENGVFLAIIGKNKLTAPSMKEMQKKIDALSNTVKAIKTYNVTSTNGPLVPYVVNVSGQDKRSHRFRDDEGKLIDGDLFEYDAVLLNEMNDLDEEYSQLRIKRKAILEKAKKLKITP